MIIRLLPQALPKAYRFVGEMEEVGGFVGAEGASTFEGLAGIFARVAAAHEKTPQSDTGDVQLLLKFVEQARKSRDEV